MAVTALGNHMSYRHFFKALSHLQTRPPTLYATRHPNLHDVVFFYSLQPRRRLALQLFLTFQHSPNTRKQYQRARRYSLKSQRHLLATRRRSPIPRRQSPTLCRRSATTRRYSLTPRRHPLAARKPHYDKHLPLQTSQCSYL
jgi:hypothetical protein